MVGEGEKLADKVWHTRTLYCFLGMQKRRCCWAAGNKHTPSNHRLLCALP